MTTASQFANAAVWATIDQPRNQKRWGRASSSRKKTVSRDRRPSSARTRRTGWRLLSTAPDSYEARHRGVVARGPRGDRRAYDRLSCRLPVSPDDVHRAREAIGGRLHRTPTFSSRTLSERTGASVHLKAELFQRTGSFKPRGVLTNLAALSDAERRAGVIGISAGNHAQALAYGASLEGIDSLVVMWQGASEAKIAATREYGAAVDLSASGPAEAFERLAEVQEQTGRTLVHPFDHPRTMAGPGNGGARAPGGRRRGRAWSSFRSAAAG